MKHLQHQRGSGHVGVMLLIVVFLVIGAGGYFVYTSNQKQAAADQTEQAASDERAATKKKQQQTEEIARTDKDQILVALDTYCKSKYKSFWEGTYGKTIDPTTITSGYDDSVEQPFVIDGSHALVSAAKCDTTQLTELQKFAPFMLYFDKSPNWTAVERYQTTPPCKDFDGDGWPASIVPSCVDNGVTRAPSAEKAGDAT